MTYNELYERDGYPEFPAKKATKIVKIEGRKFIKVKTKDPVNGRPVFNSIELK